MVGERKCPWKIECFLEDLFHEVQSLWWRAFMSGGGEINDEWLSVFELHPKENMKRMREKKSRLFNRHAIPSLRFHHLLYELL